MFSLTLTRPQCDGNTRNAIRICGDHVTRGCIRVLGSGCGLKTAPARHPGAKLGFQKWIPFGAKRSRLESRKRSHLESLKGSHLESLKRSDLESLKRSDLEGLIRFPWESLKWSHFAKP